MNKRKPMCRPMGPIPTWRGEVDFGIDLTPDEHRAMDALEDHLGHGAVVNVGLCEFTRVVFVSYGNDQHRVWTGPLPLALADATYN